MLYVQIDNDQIEKVILNVTDTITATIASVTPVKGENAKQGAIQAKKARVNPHAQL
jgi:hypothetical protein